MAGTGSFRWRFCGKPSNAYVLNWEIVLEVGDGRMTKSSHLQDPKDDCTFQSY